MILLVRIAHRDGEHELPVPIWIRLASGEYVRYDHIVSIRIQE